MKFTNLGSHAYGNAGEAKWLAKMMHKEFGLPVWITEFAFWKAGSDQEEIEYRIETVEFYERSPFVAGYAWFKERVEGNPKLSLLGKSGELTALGKAYVEMPVHDPEVYYRVPGRMQSESYTTAESPTLVQTNDADGFLEVRALGPTNSLDYQIAADAAGTYTLKLRAASAGSGKIEVLSGENVVATVEPKEKGWQTFETPVTLVSGTQTLRIRPAMPVKLNWMEFVRK
jgi:hypothetical protein